MCVGESRFDDGGVAVGLSGGVKKGVGILVVGGVGRGVRGMKSVSILMFPYYLMTALKLDSV